MLLLELSISGGILILFILILRLLAINKLPKKTFMLLWDITLLRLLIPFYFPVQNSHIPYVRKVAEQNSGEFARQEKIEHIPSANTIFPHLDNIDWKIVIWLIGMILFLTYFGRRYTKEYRKIRTALPISKEAEVNLRLWGSVPNRVKILVSDRTLTPLTFGIISPKIVLPKFLNLENQTELTYVLTHELVHIKRTDNLRKIMMLITVSIYWFNPFVWIMRIFFNRDIELSCDEKVMSLLGQKPRKEYAMVLINLAEKQYHRSLFSSGLGNNDIQERIVAIMKFKKVTVVSIICSVVLVGTAMTAFAKNDSKIPNENMPSYNTPQNKRDAKTVRMDNSGNAVEIADIDDNKNDVPLIGDTEQFLEYEKYGLSYDFANDHLVYSEQIVGYFHDEKAKDVYTHITDDMGTIGIVVMRDSKYKITGLKKISIPENSSVIETNGENETD